MRITLLTICCCLCFGGCNFWKEINSKSKIWYPVKMFYIWIPQTVTCKKNGSKIIAIGLCKTWNRILKASIPLKPEGDEKWKSRKSINIDQLYLTSFFKNIQKMKISIFQICGFYDFFFSSKAWNLPKTLKILFFVLYDITYIQNIGNGNNYLNLPIN